MVSDDHRHKDSNYMPPTPTPDPHREPEFTDAEKRELRELMEADRRVKWFWATTRKASIWIAAFLGAIAISWEAFVKLVRSALG